MTSLLPSRASVQVSPADAAAELLRRRRARASMLEFATYTKEDYAPGWHHRLLCSYLDQFIAGKIRRLIVSMPPQHGKSELISRRLPAYILGRNPDTRLICCSHTASLASDMNRDVQRIIDGDEYGMLFPDTRLSDTNVKADGQQGKHLRNSEVFEIVGRRGFYKCAGVGGAIVGKGFDFGIIDDPVKSREVADSPTQREAIWKWYTGDFLTRKGGDHAQILIVMTRWHEEDLVGKLLTLQRDDEHADRWTVLTLPAIREEDDCPDDPRQIGEALWPERYPIAELEKTRAASPYDWWSQYQQHPRAPGSVEWPDEYFPPSIWFEDWPAMSAMPLRVMSLDPSKGKDAKAGDFSAFVMLGMTADGMLWCDADLDRRPTPKIVDDGLAIYERFKPEAFVIETNQFQELLAGEFVRVQRERSIHVLKTWGIDNTLNKIVRIRTLGPLLAQRRIRFRASRGGRQLVKQLRDFACGEHDDGPDALEMAVRMLGALLGQGGDGAPTVLRV